MGGVLNRLELSKILSIFSSKGTKKITLPNCWSELPTGVYQRIMKEWDKKDIVQLFSILSGKDYKVLHDTKDPDLEQRLYDSIQFLYESEPKFKEAELPKFFIFDKHYIPIQKDATALTIGQSVIVRQRLDEASSYDELISIAIAVYIQPLADRSEFDPFKAFDLEEKIKELPITETYPLGFFLLRPLMKPGKITGNKWSHIFTQWLRVFTKSAGLIQRRQKLVG